MIDPTILRNDPDRIRESQRRRGEDVSVVDDLVAADLAKRAAQQEFDELRNQQKLLGKQIGPLQGAAIRRSTCCPDLRNSRSVRLSRKDSSMRALKVRMARSVPTIRSMRPLRRHVSSSMSRSRERFSGSPKTRSSNSRLPLVFRPADQ